MKNGNQDFMMFLLLNQTLIYWNQWGLILIWLIVPKIQVTEKQNSLTNLDTIGLWKHQVLEADQVFGHRERVAFGLALMIFEDVGYEDVYKFIDNLLKEKKEN